MVDKSIMTTLVKTNKKVFDPVGFAGYENLWHRGVPLEMINKRKYFIKPKQKIIPKIQASFWNGDPDIDAIARILFKPNCIFDKKKFPFFSKSISPFNSQNTFISKEILSDYFLFPGIGRMEDIWASFYISSKKYKIIYTEPTVIQKRNKHNLITDFKNEYLGYTKNFELIDAIKKDPENINNFLPKRTLKAFDEWRKIISILKKRNN